MSKSCHCPRCVNLCLHNPGWMTPTEAELAIKAGLSNRLMRDWLEPSDEIKNKERIYVLCPASEGCEGKDAPDFDMYELIMSSLTGSLSKGECTFLNEHNRCELHTTGFKPIECRLNFGCRPRVSIRNHTVAKLWNTPKGRAVLAKWKP